MVISLQPKWNAYSIPAGMEGSFHFDWNGMRSFHSCRNGMATPFLQEWNEHSIPAGMECHSTPNLKKYASWLVPAIYIPGDLVFGTLKES